MDFKDDQCDLQLQRFYEFYIENHPEKSKVGKSLIDLRKKLNQFLPASLPSDRRNAETSFLKPKFDITHSSQDGTYLWFLKPPDLNRGRGIKIFSTLDQFESSLLEFLEGYEIKPFTSPPPPPKEDLVTSTAKKDDSKEKDQQKENTIVDKKEKSSSAKYLVKHTNFVVQKYIEKPLLINNRKFDIRVWVMITHTLDVYFFKLNI